MRVYPRQRDQLPDPKIEAVEGAGTVPAYRGTAYVVIEDLELGRFGNRVPQLTFEVIRPPQPGCPAPSWIRRTRCAGVAMLPAAGNTRWPPRPVTMALFGSGRAASPM